MRLEKLFRNAIYDAVVEGGLDARDCTFDHDDARAQITHVPSGSYFLLEGQAGNYTATTVVGEYLPSTVQAFMWSTVEDKVERWAREVKRDVETPDLWAELQGDREILTGTRYEDVENTPFTPDEQAEIAEQLREIKEYVKKTYSLSDEQMLSLEAKLEDIQAAAGRIGRKDWQLLFYGVMLTVIVGGLVPPEVVQAILTMALHGLGHLFGHGGTPLLPGGPQPAV